MARPRTRPGPARLFTWSIYNVFFEMQPSYDNLGITSENPVNVAFAVIRMVLIPLLIALVGNRYLKAGLTGKRAAFGKQKADL